MNFDQLFQRAVINEVEANVDPITLAKNYASSFKSEPETTFDWMVGLTDPIHWAVDAFRTGYDLGGAIVNFEQNPSKENALKVLICLFFASLTVAPGARKAKLPVK